MSDNVKWAQAEIAKHRAAIADLEAYIRVEESKGRGDEPRPFESQADAFHFSQAAGRGAKKRAILQALILNPQGLRTPQIVALLQRGGFDADVSNTSPQLSSYGTATPPLVKHEGGIWAITDAGREYLLAAVKN